MYGAGIIETNIAMNYQRGAVVVWVIVLLIIVAIAGATVWHLTGSSAQPSSTSATDSQDQGTTDASQADQQTQTQPVEQDTLVPMQPSAEFIQQTNRTSVPGRNLSSSSSHVITVRNQNGQIMATLNASGSWQFTFAGAFAFRQQSYALNFGDGTRITLQCETPSVNGNVCDQFTPVSHTYTQPGSYQVELVETSDGTGNGQNSTLLSMTVPDSTGSSTPAPDNTPPAGTPSGGGSGGSNSNDGSSISSGDGRSPIQAGCTFMTPGGGCITLIH